MPFLDGDPPSAPPPASQNKSRRVALVIGNGRYTHAGILKNPANDAASMASALAALGFEVVGGAKDGVDLDYAQLAARIRDFGRRLRDEVETALLFYAGHGLQVGGRNYLVPIDAALETEGDVGSELYELQYILNQMERPKRTSIVLLDACRNNPLARNLARAMGLGDTRSAGITEGLAAQQVVAGTLIAYATQPEHVAYDGDGTNGFFTEALLAHLPTPGREIEQMLRDVRTKVVAATEKKKHGPQVPWVHSSLLGASFYFKPNAAVFTPQQEPNPAATTAHHVVAQEWAQLQASTDVQRLKRFAHHFPGYFGDLAIDRLQFLEAEAEVRAKAEAERRQREEIARRHEAEWQQAEAADTTAAYESFLAAWTGGPHVEMAKQKLATIRQHTEGQRLAEGPFQASMRTARGDEVRSLKAGEVFRDAGGPEMVVIRPGTFMMGEAGQQHSVTIAKPFAVGKYPVTFAEWDAAGLARKPGDEGWGRGRRPVINVSWDDAKAYAAWLSNTTVKGYRLLSEAEWEYCCRAGTTTTYSFGDTITKEQAQFSDVDYGSTEQTVEVGKFPANAFGLHDMHGNVWEWCEDPWHPDYNGAPPDGSCWTTGGDTSSRVRRGGSWGYNPRFLRSASRGGNRPGFRGGGSGFRLARTLNP